MVVFRPSSLRLALLLSSILLPASSALAQQAGADSPNNQGSQSPVTGIEQVTVTATRQAQDINQVPLSVTAYSAEDMQAEGIREVDDLSRFTPGLNFTRGQSSGSSITNTSINIRGITSGPGPSTTGIYIDDTPIQTRSLGNFSSSDYPVLFDLQRVEILKGPQGTLFGSGVMGGAVRFITPQPSLTEDSGYARVEYGNTQNAASSYEAGVAFGGPIVDNVLGFRISAYYRMDGGWIDRTAGTGTVLPASATTGPLGSFVYNPTGITVPNSNWQETFAVDGAVTYSPISQLTITPSVKFQHIYTPDVTQSFYEANSDPSAGIYRIPQFVGTVNSTHIAIQTKGEAPSPSDDAFVLPTLHAEYDMGDFAFINNTSYYVRTQHYWYDGTERYDYLYQNLAFPNPGDQTQERFAQYQRNFVEEFRFQSTNPDARLNWVSGIYYADDHQNTKQNIYANFFDGLTKIQPAIVAGYPTPSPSVANGAPFGPGYDAFVNYYGLTDPNGFAYGSNFQTIDDEAALFGNVDYKVFDWLKLTVGARVAVDNSTYQGGYTGATNNQNLPSGQACVPGTGLPSDPACVPVAIGQYAPGQGPFAPAFASVDAKAHSEPINPKFEVEYTPDTDTLVYALAAKGYRQGGGIAAVPARCDAQLATLGYVNSSGEPYSPTSYQPDSLWSYEIGTKDKFFGGRLQLNSDAFEIFWKNIQSSVSLNTCGNSIIANSGNATSRGVELQATALPIDNLVVGLNFSYTDATYDNAFALGGRVINTRRGAITASPPIGVNSNVQYNYKLYGLEAYTRADYEYSSTAPRAGVTDPGTFSYDPYAYIAQAYSFVNARTGIKVGDSHPFDISFYINNLLNTDTYLNVYHETGRPVYQATTFRPRTFGLTASTSW